ncbi:MAG: exodeoxyribonuclease VII large subunit, partial [Brevundimonas sp.]
AGGRILEDRRTRLRAAARGLPARPEDLLALPQQRLDHAGSRLASGLTRNLAVHERGLITVAGRLTPALLDRAMERRRDRLGAVSARLGTGLAANVKAHEHRLLRALARFSPEPLHRRLDQRAARLESVAGRLIALPRRLERDEARLAALSRALSGLNPKTPKPGFARVESEDGAMIAAAAALRDGQAVRLVFADGARGAHIDGDDPAPARARASAPPSRPKSPPPGQGDLF